jgi:hypothetical protein
MLIYGPFFDYEVIAKKTNKRAIRHQIAKGQVSNKSMTGNLPPGRPGGCIKSLLGPKKVSHTRTT